MKFEYGTQIIEFTVKYSKRKTIGISIKPPDVVTVTAPKGVDEETILKAVKSRGKWIVQKIFELKQMEHLRQEKVYVNGETFMYLGENYALQIVVDNTIKLPETKLYQGKFYVTSPTKEQQQIRSAMEKWYRKQTLEKVTERISYYQRYFKVQPHAIVVKEQKKRWASCSSKRNLNFNWRCVMAPVWVLDYIVVHEMCHLVHMNHSKEFWALVERIMPDYKRHREWLKNNGMKMDL